MFAVWNEEKQAAVFYRLADIIHTLFCITKERLI